MYGRYGRTGRRRDDRAAANRVLWQKVPAEEVDDHLGPLDAMSRSPRSRQLVTLAGEADELGGAAEEPQRDEQLFGLIHRAPQIVLGVQDEERRRHLVHVRDRRLPQPRLR